MAQADSVHSTPPLNTSANNPSGSSAEFQNSRYLPTDTTPEQLFRAIGKLRKDARDEIDRLIQFLDETENHMELEPTIRPRMAETTRTATRQSQPSAALTGRPLKPGGLLAGAAILK